MRNSTLPKILACASLCATAAANNFSVNGGGGAIPDCPNSPGTWNVQPTWATLTSTVAVANPVTSITAVKLLGLTHTYRGDVHVFIEDPAGARYNVVVRPGFDGSASGNSGDYSAGDYTFVQSGGGSVNQGATNIAPGTYNQFLNTGGGMWTSGTYVINNTPLNSITGPAGTWTLNIVDWWNLDTGSITGWTLEGTDSVGFTSFCDPGVGGVVGCPCGNPPSGAGRGCNNFGSITGGATLSAAGNASLAADTLVFTCTGENNTAFSVFLQGTVNNVTGVPYGAGVRCVAGALKRLYTGAASGGTITRPGGTDPDVHTRSAALGDPILAGQTRYYSTYYRDPSAAVPCGNPLSTFNDSQAGSIVWGP
jgi:subtilisin-like proprotein convertase family protein